MPADFSSVALKCLAKHPTDRFQSFSELAAGLADAARPIGLNGEVAPLSTSALEQSMSATDWEGRGKALLTIGDGLIERNQKTDAKSYLEQGLAALQRAVDVDGESDSRHFAIGQLLQSLDRPSEAIPHFKQLLSKAPSLTGSCRWPSAKALKHLAGSRRRWQLSVTPMVESPTSTLSARVSSCCPLDTDCPRMPLVPRAR